MSKKKKIVVACLNLKCAKAKKHVKGCFAYGREYPRKKMKLTKKQKYAQSKNRKFLLKFDLDETFNETEVRISAITTLLIDKKIITLKEATERLKLVRKWFRK